MFNIRGITKEYQTTFSIKLDGENWTNCLKKLKDISETISLEETAEIEIKLKEEKKEDAYSTEN